MSDLFHELVPDEFVAQVFDVMRRCPQHTFQILTKHIERAAAWRLGWEPYIWLGTSVEDRRVTQRIDLLRRATAAVKFISFESLIGPVGPVDLAGVDWAIVGGESGPGYRRLDPAWAREIQDACLKAGTAFFFKQDAVPITELRPWLVEADGSQWRWQQYPGQLDLPERIAQPGHLAHTAAPI